MSWGDAIRVAASLVLPLIFLSCGAFEKDAKKSEHRPRGSEEARHDPEDPPGDDGSQDEIETEDPAEEDPEEETPEDQEEEEPQCVAPEGVSNAPQTMEDVVRLINALPKPVTIACYVEALARPLRVNATTSQLSVQPAVGRQNPRIFFFSGPLITTFVATGPGSKTVEFSHLLSDSVSVKGEIAFPVTENLPMTAAYDQIRRDGEDGTRCTGCHSGESAADSPFPEGAYASRALKPLSTQKLPLDELRATAVECKDESARCQIYRALFGHGDVLPTEFPESMPTLF